MQAFAAIQAAHGKEPRGAPYRNLHFHFLQTPFAVETTASGQTTALQLYENRLCTDAIGTQILERTGASSTLQLDLLLKSVGYRAAALPGVPFDERNAVIPNEMGRVLTSAARDSEREPGLYTCGWVKRGPTGIIGTNVVDAEQTAGCVVEDVASGAVPRGVRGCVDRGLAELLQVRPLVPTVIPSF